MPTVLEALQWPNVTFDAAFAPTGKNTIVRTNIEIEAWEEWDDFTLNNITAILGKWLYREYHGDKEPKPLEKDLQVYDETSADDGLRKFMFTVINNALNSMTTRQGAAPYYGRGTRCPCYRLKPDWALISDARLNSDGSYIPLLNGDTKSSAKFTPEMLEFDIEEWKRVITQLAAYSAENCNRYSFALTDQTALFLRFARAKSGLGIAANRSQRSTGRTQASDIAMGMSDPIQLSSDPSQGSSPSYVDDNPHNWNYIVQYKAIPLGIHGPGKLTAKLAYVALATMSLFGDNYINYGYPGLNTWRTASGEEGGGIKHNTSGAKLPAWERGIIMHEPDFFMQNDSEEEEEEEEEDDDDDDDDDNGPQISRAASTFGDSQPSRTYVGSSSKEEKHVEFKKVGRKWCYLDYRGERKPYKDGEFKECFAEDGSRRFVKDGKKHVYVASKLPKDRK